MRATMLLLTALLVTACEPVGDFCVVYGDPIGPLTEASARQLVTDNRSAAEDIAVRDEYWRENCAQ
jgi:polysaccharide pyruvyl transferase WcaK-like protein